MKNTYYLLSIFCLLAVGCKAQLGTNAVTQIQVSPCYLEEETFENTALGKFLKTSTLRRDIIENFLNSNFEFCILSIIDNNIMIATYDGTNWKVENNEKKYTVTNNKILKLVEDYSSMNKVLKMSCPENYVIYDVNEFQAFWVKKKSDLKFLYYSTTYEMSELKNLERQKVDGINEIMNMLNM